MFTYVQATGNLYRDGIFVAQGNSGIGDFRNLPSGQDRHLIGVIPVGIYELRVLMDVQGNLINEGHHSAPVFMLEPDGINKMFGRCGFALSGESRIPGRITPDRVVIDSYDVRKAIAAAAIAGDTTFVVVDTEKGREIVDKGVK